MDQGGEGVIIRDPSSPYQAGRSSGFLKHKVLEWIPLCPNSHILHSFQKYRDAEARIIRNESGVSWECEMYVLLPFYNIFYVLLFILFALGRTEFDLLRQQELQSLRSGSIHNLEIL